MKMKLLLILLTFLVSGFISSGSDTTLSFSENDVVLQPHMVDLTLIQGADSKGAGVSLFLT